MGDLIDKLMLTGKELLGNLLEAFKYWHNNKNGRTKIEIGKI